MRVAVAQINTVLADFKYNQDKILDYIHRAKEKHCEIVVFPESTLLGYHPFDLLEREKLIDQQLKSLKSLHKAMPAGIVCLVGLITKNPSKKGRPYFNSAVRLEKSKKPQFFHKQLLPTGDVFDEARFIESGDMKNNYFSVGKKKIFLTICEDIWAWPDSKGHSQYFENPIQSVPRKKVDLIINMSASPFYPGKDKIRQDLVKKTATFFKAPMIYCNMVGAQDEIVFDGGSFCLSKNGKLLMQSMLFEEDLNVIDLDKQEGGIRPNKMPAVEVLRRAIVLGIKDFCSKAGIEKVHLGLSGGIDSALVACLAVDALGSSRVCAIAMPGPYSADVSLSLAQKLAKNLAIQLINIPISDLYNSGKNLVEKSFQTSEFGTAHENLQARMRGMVLMAYANLKNSLLLATSNKSELATGYSTLYGDMCGGLMPIGDLTKAQVYEISKAYNLEHELIPKEIIDRAPSAELRPNQKDQDSLPEYEKLDASVENLVEKAKASQTETDKWLMPVLLKTEFKRWQAPPILKISRHSFGRGRRWPIAHKAKDI